MKPVTKATVTAATAKAKAAHKAARAAMHKKTAHHYAVAAVHAHAVTMMVCYRGAC